MPQTVLITGCSSGFGYDLAQTAARAGHRVYATMRAPDGKNAEAAGALRDLARGESLDLRVLDLDVTDDASVEAAAQTVADESGAADVVVNNAGQMFGGITEAFSAEELARQLDVNVVGVHRVVRAFLPAMREAGRGLVVNVSSTAGRCALPFFGVYHASKWALEGYTAALRLELAQTGVDAVIVEPGPFTTNLFSGMTAPADADGRAASYPPAVTGVFEAMGADFQQMLASPDTPTDPALVVDAMAELLAMPSGTRPLRTVVGMDFGVRDRNADDARHDDALFHAFGLTDFATLALSETGTNGHDAPRVTFTFDQSATGPGAFAGTFEASGAISDAGTTEDRLDVSSPEGASPLVATFRRTVTGERGRARVARPGRRRDGRPRRPRLGARGRDVARRERDGRLRGPGGIGGDHRHGRLHARPAPRASPLRRRPPIARCAVPSSVTALALALGGCASGPASSAMPDDLQVVAARYAAAWCSQEPARAASFYSEDGVLALNGGEPSVGREAITEAARGFMVAFPDMVVALDSLREGAEGVEYHWTLTGTTTGPGGTGRSVRISRFETRTAWDDGRIAESRGRFDADEYRRQLEHGADTP